MPSIFRRVLSAKGEQAPNWQPSEQRPSVTTRCRSECPSKDERQAIKNALKAQGFKEKNVITRLFGRDLDVSVLDDEVLTREQVAEIVIAMQRILPRGA